MFNKIYLPSHEITPLTMAITTKEDKYGNLTTIILEEQEEYHVKPTPSKVIDQACKFFGSSLKGRQDGTRDICGITHKAPIAIDPISGMYFFPTISPVNPTCSWIAHSHIDEIKNARNSSTELLFKNGKKLILDVSYGIMLNQIQRTAQFRFLLDNRIKSLQKHVNDMVVEPYA